MSLAGSAVVAIWNDITEDGRANFIEWHNREHIPERLGIDGFLRGRRYAAIAGAPAYFTLYEVRDTGVLSSAAYLARLNAPTAWTARSVRDFRNTARSLCRTELSLGQGSGGVLGTVRFDCPPDRDAALLQRLTATLASLAEAPGIAAVHVCRADLAASTAKTAEQAGRPANAVPRWVVLLEATAPDLLRPALAAIAALAGEAAFAATDIAAGAYTLQFDLLG